MAFDAAHVHFEGMRETAGDAQAMRLDYLRKVYGDEVVDGMGPGLAAVVGADAKADAGSGGTSTGEAS